MKRKLISSLSLQHGTPSPTIERKQVSFTRKLKLLEPIIDRSCKSRKKQIKPTFQISRLNQQLTTSSWIIFDIITNKTYGKRINSEKQIASLTKIMTCIIVLQLIQKYKLDKDVKVKVSKTSSGLGGTSANLIQDSWLNVQDLLYGLMLPSGNDAAWLLAEVFGLLIFYQKYKSPDTLYKEIQSIDLSTYDCTDHFIDKFLKVMNRKAKQLNMSNTNFSNPHGLPNSTNYSSVKDLSILCKYCLTNLQFVDIINTKSYFTTFKHKTQQIDVQWKNTNRLLYQGWMGIKTGQTISAGSCLASFRQGIIIIVLGASNLQKRFDDTTIIYDFYYNWKFSSCSTS